MRKKFTMLLAALFLVMGTAWAQKLVTSVVEGKYYTLECNSTQAHLTNRFLGENGSGLNGQSAKPTYLIFEAAEGGYHVKSALTGKYLNQGVVIAEGSKYAVDYSTTATTVWTIGKLADDATDVYLTIGDTKFYLNNNYDGDHKLQIVKHDPIGTGNACSLWEMREHEDGYKVIESIGENITDLNQLTDGSYVVLYNVGKQKYIYEGLEHKLWMGTAATEGAGHEYIWRVRKEGDKYAFMAMSGRYFSFPLDGQDVYTVGIDNNAKDEFTITDHTEDNTKWLVKSSNINKWWDAQDDRFVGWNGNGDNSKYEIKPVVVKGSEHELADFITADENIIKWVNIKNVRSGKFATYEGESTKMTQKTDNACSRAFFYLTGEIGSNGALVKIHNFATDNLCAEYNSWTAAGTNWNIMASQGQGFHPGWAISKGTTLDNGNAWNNEGGGGSTIAYWNGNDQGSTWAFVSADYHALVSKLDGLKKELKSVVADANTAYEEGNVTESPVTLSATEGEDGFLYSNAEGKNNPYESDRAGVAALIDGMDNTFLHTDYSGADSKDKLDHYIRVDMGEGKTIDYFSFGYKTRATNGGNEPKTMVIEGSNDNVKYYEIATLTNLPSGTGVTYTSEPMGGKPYRYIRFMVKETTNGSAQGGHQFFALASFNLNKVTVKDGAAVKTLVYNNLPKSVAEAERVLASSKSTEDDINGMKGLLLTIVAGLEVKEYPFELTMNINDPVCYHIKSARSYEYGGNYYWTFENGKVTTIVPNDEYKKDVEAYWFFMENPMNGQLQLVPFIEHTKPMGYTTVGNSKDRLTNNTSASGFVGTGYIFKEDTESTGDWMANYPYALKPAEGGDNYVSNCNGKDGHYMGFWNDFNDKGTRFDLEEAIVPSSKLRDLRTALAACTDIPAEQAKNEIGWYNVDSYATYSGIMTSARNAYNDATLAEDSYLMALEYLQRDPATALEINMPQSGKFYRIKNNSETGYLSSGESDRTQFKADIATDASSIFYYDGDRKLLSYKNGMYLNVNDNKLVYSEAIGTGVAVEFQPSRTIGKLQILFNSNRYLFSETAGNTDSGDINAKYIDPAGGNPAGRNANYLFTVEEVTWLPVAMNTTVGYATLYSPVELELSYNRVKAYTGKVSANGEKLQLIEQSVVPANTGVILELQEGAAVEDEYVFLQIKENSVEVTDNELVGGFAKSEKNTAKDVYTLQCPDKNNVEEYIGLYLFKGYTDPENQAGTKTYINGFRAWLELEPGQEAPVMFSFGRSQGTTSIDNAQLTIDNTAVIYDLTGRRVEKMEKGIYIVNGKKVVIK